jgi:hypothetical protein
MLSKKIFGTSLSIIDSKCASKAQVRFKKSTPMIRLLRVSRMARGPRPADADGRAGGYGGVSGCATRIHRTAVYRTRAPLDLAATVASTCVRVLAFVYLRS